MRTTRLIVDKDVLSRMYLRVGVNSISIAEHPFNIPLFTKISFSS